MFIVRDGQKIELTRQELFEAHEAYEYDQAIELMRERITAEIGQEAAIDDVIDAAVGEYLSDHDAGCDDEFCIDNAIEVAQDEWDRIQNQSLHA